MTKYYKLILSLGAAFLLASVAEADGVIVIVKDGRVERRDDKGLYKGLVGNKGAIQAVTDGDWIVVLYDDGKIIRYDNTGTYKGLVEQIGNAKAIAIQLSAGQITVTYEKDKPIRYDVKNGRYKGRL